MSAPRLGSPHVHHRLADSTNELAKRLAERGAPHGTTVTADEQHAGRGRQGRTWSAPAGRALLVSTIVRDLDSADRLLPLAVAVAVCECCEAVAPVTCAIKWPNDVWIERRKVAGILVEGRPQEGWAVIGIGLNVSTRRDELPAGLHDAATSLRLACPEPPPLEPAAVFGPLMDALAARLADPPGRARDAWAERDALLGERVAWNGGEGTAAGIDIDGALLVDTASGQIALDAGEVHLTAAAPKREV